MKKWQLTLDFDDTVAHEATAVFAGNAPINTATVLSKEDFVARTCAVWHAVDNWILDYTPATQFWAGELGVYERIAPYCTGTFADTDRVQHLSDEWELATGVAIAAEEAALMMGEHGHADDATTLVRSFYFALALNTLGYDLEHYLPGIPVHALGQ